MTRYELWRLFLQKNETTALNLWILAGVAVFFWFQLVRGKKWARMFNVLVIGGFGLSTIGLWALSRF